MLRRLSRPASVHRAGPGETRIGRGPEEARGLAQQRPRTGEGTGGSGGGLMMHWDRDLRQRDRDLGSQ